jgi:O-antigen/teichoic acid export membrane protein
MPDATAQPGFRPTRAQTFTGVFWAALGALLRYTLAGIFTLILTHLLHPNAFGLVAIAYAAWELIAHIAPVGFHDALIQREDLHPADLNTALWSILGSAGSLAIVTLALSPAIAGWFDQPALAPILAGMTGAALLRAGGMVPRARLARRLDFRTLALVRVAGLLIGGTVAVALAAGGAGAWSLVAQIAILNAVGLGLVWRAAGWRPGWALDRSALRHLWTFAPSVSLFTVLAYVIEHADDQLVGFHLGPTQLGYYALAYGFMAWPVRDVLGGVAVVLYPVFARFQDDPDRLHAAYLEGVQLTTLFAFPVLALLAIAAPQLVPWLLGDKWQPIVLTTQIFALGGIREATMMLNGLIYRALGKPHLHTLLQLASAACYVTAFVVGLDFGIEGVALFYVLTGAALHPAAWWTLSRASGLRLNDWLGALAPAGVATGVMALVAGPVFVFAAGKCNITLLLVLASVLAGSVYAGVLWGMRPAAVVRLWDQGLGFVRSLVSST